MTTARMSAKEYRELLGKKKKRTSTTLSQKSLMDTGLIQQQKQIITEF